MPGDAAVPVREEAFEFAFAAVAVNEVDLGVAFWSAACLVIDAGQPMLSIEKLMMNY